MKEKRDAAAVRIFPPAVPLLTILAGVLLNRRWPIPLPAAVPDWLTRSLGWFVMIAAILGLGAWAIVTMRRTGQSENPWLPSTSVVTHGPFRRTRNPMYLQMILVAFGAAMLFRNVWILLLTPVGAWLLLRLAILPEEAYLEKKFGEEYLAYKRRVPRWL
ncbi:MAG TPA: isoprenylcysteine carboxylmethyltransferase family protein [Gemmatimonadales bacterium]|nr:isoprenylcysteine carboxylmethyltransferase family protein [Gemmatimonadales bacterium]